VRDGYALLGALAVGRDDVNLEDDALDEIVDDDTDDEPPGGCGDRRPALLPIPPARTNSSNS
jgi:hypothetical protein